MAWDTYHRLRGLWRPFLLIFVAECTFCSSLSPGTMVELDVFIANLMACRNIPGLTVSVVREDRLIYARGHGIKSLHTGDPVTNSTKFCIGSLSKGFTATLLAMVIGQNDSLTWDTTLHDILGKDFLLSDEHRTRFATLRDILAHKTGIPGYFGALLTGYQDSVEGMVRGLRFMPASRKFHSKYLYNNYMFILAGYVLERLTGKSIEALTRELIFTPLSMTSATFVEEFNHWEDFALPHMSFNGELRPLDTVWLKKSSTINAAGGICVNAVDMGKWMTFHLRGGRHPEGHLLVDEETFTELHTPQMPTPMPLGKKVLKPPVFPISAGRFAYNLGFGSGTYRGYHNLLHGGRVYGFDSNLWLYPDNNLGIFTSVSGPMNDDAVNGLRVLHYKISDLLLGEPSWLNHSTACLFPDPWMANSKSVKLPTIAQTDGETNDVGRARFVTSVRVRRRALISDRPTQRPLLEYAGVYGHYAFGNISVVFDKSDKMLHLRHGLFGHAVLYPSPLRHTFNMKFLGVLQYITEADGWNHLLPIKFQEDKHGRINSLAALFIEAEVPPHFVRGLNWRHIPEPEFTHHVTHCKPVTSSAGLSEEMVTLNSVAFLLAIAVWCITDLCLRGLE